MTGKHFSNNVAKKSHKKASIIIILVVVAVIIVVAAAIILIPLFGNGGGKSGLPFATHPSITEHPQATTQAVESQVQTTEKSEPLTTKSEQVSQQKSTGAESSDNQKATEEGMTMQSSNAESVLVPGDLDNATYFSATFSPYKAVDSETGEECSFKEVFGSSYSGGSIVFNSDGSFTDTLTTSSSNSGAYAVQDSNLAATYSNDRNMDISVNSWDGRTPTDIVINYGGYDVYFN